MGSQNFGSAKNLVQFFQNFVQKNLKVQKRLCQTKFGPKKFDQNKSRPPKIVSKKFCQIGSVTAEILLGLSFCGGWVVQSHSNAKPNG